MKDIYQGCPVCAFEPDPAMVLAENDSWSANLRDNDQTLLGTAVIVAKRHVHEVDFLTREESAEFDAVRNAVYGAIRRAFQPQTFNLSCLKNNAFIDADVPPEAGHVHYHLKPRYARPIQFAGHVFTDPMPGRYLEAFKRYEPSAKAARAIAGLLREHVELY